MIYWLIFKISIIIIMFIYSLEIFKSIGLIYKQYMNDDKFTDKILFEHMIPSLIVLEEKNYDSYGSALGSLG